MSRVIPAEVLEAIPPIYHFQETGLPSIAAVHLFCLQTGWEWFIAEYDPEDKTAYGLVKGFETELGSFSLEEIETVSEEMGCPILYDGAFQPMELCRI